MTTIQFGLPYNSPVHLVIYDVNGHEVWRYSENQASAGWHQVQWNGVNNLGQSVSTGVYFYRLMTGDFMEMKKMVYLK